MRKIRGQADLIGVMVALVIVILLLAGVLPHLALMTRTFEVQESLDFLEGQGYIAYANPQGTLYADNIVLSEQPAILLTGTALVFMEIRPDIDFESVRAHGTPTWVTRGIVGGFSLPIYAADNEELFLDIHAPRRWSGCCDFICHVDCYLDTANDGKKFQLGLEWAHHTAGVDVVPAGNHTLLTETDTGTAAQYQSFEVTFLLDYDIDDPDIVAAFDNVHLRLSRVAASADEIAGEVVITHIGVRFMRDKL